MPYTHTESRFQFQVNFKIEIKIITINQLNPTCFFLKFEDISVAFFCSVRFGPGFYRWVVVDAPVGTSSVTATAFNSVCIIFPFFSLSNCWPNTNNRLVSHYVKPCCVRLQLTHSEAQLTLHFSWHTTVTSVTDYRNMTFQQQLRRRQNTKFGSETGVQSSEWFKGRPFTAARTEARAFFPPIHRKERKLRLLDASWRRRPKVEMQENRINIGKKRGEKNKRGAPLAALNPPFFEKHYSFYDFNLFSSELEGNWRHLNLVANLGNFFKVSNTTIDRKVFIFQKGKKEGDALEMGFGNGRVQFSAPLPFGFGIEHMFTYTLPIPTPNRIHRLYWKRVFSGGRKKKTCPPLSAVGQNTHTN